MRRLCVSHKEISMSSRRQLSLPGAPSGALTIGLDIGYGVVKAVTSDTVITFPSVAGHAREFRFQQDEIARRHPGDQLTDEDGMWFIGEAGAGPAPAGELLRLRGRGAGQDALGNAFRLRMARAAIGKLFPGLRSRDALHVRIATGLPCDHMADAAELRRTLLGTHLVQSDSAELVANITEVMVMPQPYGTIYSRMLTPAGDLNPAHTCMRTGVCDVGTYTVDIALDDDGEYIAAQSGSVESGVFTAHERIAAALERDYRQKMPYRIVEEVLRTGVFRASGQPVDYSAEVAEALGPLRSATLNLLSEKWHGGATIDVIYLSGGGAGLVHEEVRAAYPQAQLVPEAQLANARGYLHYARFVEGSR